MTEIHNPLNEKMLQEIMEATPAPVLLFNANDASGATGLTGDSISIAGLGGHALPVCTGVYIRDTLRIHDFYALDSEIVEDQAQRVVEDTSICAIKVGFLGSTENVSAVAELLSDYPDHPVVAYMPDVSWWDSALIDDYFDAFAELILPQTDILVGNFEVLRRWLLSERDTELATSPRDIAQAAEAFGAGYVVVTGLGDAANAENVLCNAQSVIVQSKNPRLAFHFVGAGDALSSAIAGLLAQNLDLQEAFEESLEYLDQCLAGGFQIGMGHFVLDRLFEMPSPEAAELALDALPEAIKKELLEQHDAKRNTL